MIPATGRSVQPVASTSKQHLNAAKQAKFSKYGGVQVDASKSGSARCAATVHSILGVTERALTKLPVNERAKMMARVALADTRVVEVFVNQKTGSMTPTGKFSTPTIGELRAVVDRLLPALSKHQEEEEDKQGAETKLPEISVLEGVDIGALQATLTSEQRAMVQVASNFNCLEVPSAYSKPDGGKLVDMASADHTQGPAAVFGTLSAYLLRTHFCFQNDSDQQQDEAFETGVCQVDSNQVKEEQQQIIRLPQRGGVDPATNVNLLQNVREYCGVPVTGKLTLSGSETPMPLTEDSLQAVVDRVCVGLHTDCPVLFGRRAADKHQQQQQVFELKPRASTAIKSKTVELPVWNEVDHVLSASINMCKPGVHRLEGEGYDGSGLLQICRCLLRAAYEGAYLSAIARQRKDLCVHEQPLLLDILRRCYSSCGLFISFQMPLLFDLHWF